ncbi:hepatic triacylglycerol lipase [Culex quinquefasciatus]|uniref:Hepatic triacylglycerol lipase n=1 Tax=Culex quinquefasciatus TaxID=7176 RepID=B0WSY1_CULQU|nr:hepatic triacylglycerol lipase [Culex quinquefasciatus]|eukprot:XP_001853511.1 hepatic triacylglycerol lipase [Culex quinquefasciatus]
MKVLIFLISASVFRANFANEMPLYPEDDLTTKTTNRTIAPFPFTWDRNKFMLLPNKQGKLELFDRNRVYQIRLESRSYDAAQDVHFLFFSRTNGGKPVKFTIDQVGDLPSHGFRKQLPTKILIHGWMGNSESDVVEPLARAYLEKGDVNVIGVVWAKISGDLNYPKVAFRVPMVGELVAEMVDKLLELGQVGDQIGMVGHSLGAHVAGLAGKKTRQKVAYIVGLDPADFLFSLDKPQGRLSSEDAQNVEVIHSNGGSLAMFENIGTADFYPNGGRSQPGCGLDFLWICSHGRAVTYFKESLMARGYFANRCSDLDNLHSKCSLGRVEFGEIHVHPLAKKPRGVYYFETNENEPYLRTIAQEVPRKQGSPTLPTPVEGSSNWPSSYVLSVRRKVTMKQVFKYIN